MNRASRRATLSRIRATRDEWHPFELVTDIPADRLEKHRARVGDLRSCWRNNIYAVQVFARAGAMHLAIRRHDGAEVRGWSDLQRIKTELYGPERVAIEIYPRESELENAANMRHLFVLPEDEDALPKYTYVQCAHPDCKREGHFQYDNQKDAARIHKEQSGRWKCDDHWRMHERLTPETPERTTRLVSRKVERCGDALFWNGSNGLAHGPGFEARAEDWPEGTTLEVTARVILPVDETSTKETG